MRHALAITQAVERLPHGQVSPERLDVAILRLTTALVDEAMLRTHVPPKSSLTGDDVTTLAAILAALMGVRDAAGELADDAVGEALATASPTDLATELRAAADAIGRSRR